MRYGEFEVRGDKVYVNGEFIGMVDINWVEKMSSNELNLSVSQSEVDTLKRRLDEVEESINHIYATKRDVESSSRPRKRGPKRKRGPVFNALKKWRKK